MTETLLNWSFPLIVAAASIIIFLIYFISFWKWCRFAGKFRKKRNPVAAEKFSFAAVGYSTSSTPSPFIFGAGYPPVQVGTDGISISTIPMATPVFIAWDDCADCAAHSQLFSSGAVLVFNDPPFRVFVGGRAGDSVLARWQEYKQIQPAAV